jgi:hypothetical protein
MAVYSTTFPVDEDPISEGGVWNHTSTGITKPISVGGTAFPKDTGADDDSYVRYTVGDMGTDYRVEGTVFRDANLLVGDTDTFELELHFHGSESGTGVSSYEQVIEHFGGDSGRTIVRWDDLPASFTVLTLTVDASGIPSPIADGYKIRSEVVQNVISWCLSTDGGATFNQFDHYNYVSDATKYSTGDPGFGLYSGNANLPNMRYFGFKDITITSLAPAVAITGTATAGITEGDIVAGGKTVIATVSGDTFVPLSSTPGIVLRGTPKANNAANGGNVVLTWDTGGNAPQTGDWIVIFGGHGNAVTTLLPPGVNAVNDGSFTNIAAHTGSAPVIGAWKKKMGATPDLKATCSGAGNASDGVAYIGYVLRNVDPTTSEDASATFNNASSTNPHPNSITTVTDGAVVLAMAASRVNDTSPGTVSGYSNQITSNGNDTNPMTVSAMLKTVASHGAENPGAYSSWSTGLWNAFTIALRPQVDTPFNNILQNIINGMVGNSTDAHNWNTEVKSKLAVNAVARTNNTVVTVTLNAAAAYDITTNENVLVTIPGVALAGGANIAGTPQFVIAIAGGAGASIKYPQLEHAIRGAFRGLILGARY